MLGGCLVDITASADRMANSRYAQWSVQFLRVEPVILGLVGCEVTLKGADPHFRDVPTKVKKRTRNKHPELPVAKKVGVLGVRLYGLTNPL